MKRIASLILFAVLGACLNCEAQIKQDDLLISRQQYEQLRSHQLMHQVLKARLDSLAMANRLLVAELEALRNGERFLKNTVDHLESRNRELQATNGRLSNSVGALRNTANKYRFRYEQGPQIREHTTLAFIWAGLMSAAFYFALHDELKREAFWGTTASSATIITLAIGLNLRTKKHKTTH